MQFPNEALIEGVEQRDTRKISRLISLVENNVPRSREVLSAIYKNTGQAHVIGVTGSPGSGKSTLVDQLAEYWQEKGDSVAVLAVDPSSPFTGGAVLGDRIRMSKSSARENVFVRSMASRGSLGGLSRATADAVEVLDAAGFNHILVETVGVGQGEVDVMNIVSTCIVVLVPGMGDSVQSMKAGIMEIADLFVLNKADREGVDELQRDIRMVLSLASYSEEDWRPLLRRTVATKGEGIEDLASGLSKHREWLDSSTRGEERREQMVRDRIVRLVADRVLTRVSASAGDRLGELAAACLQRKKDPHTAATELLASIKT